MFFTKKRERTTRKQRSGPTRAAPLTRGLLCLVFTMGMLSVQQETRADNIMKELITQDRKMSKCIEGLEEQMKVADEVSRSSNPGEGRKRWVDRVTKIKRRMEAAEKAQIDATYDKGCSTLSPAGIKGCQSIIRASREYLEKCEAMIQDLKSLHTKGGDADDEG